MNFANLQQKTTQIKCALHETTLICTDLKHVWRVGLHSQSNSLALTHAVFEEPEDPFHRNFFSEIISSISGIKFSNSGRYLISRDFVSVKVWDINMNSRPVECYNVHEFLRSKLCSLYENEYIFDKFECCFDGSDR